MKKMTFTTDIEFVLNFVAIEYIPRTVLMPTIRKQQMYNVRNHNIDVERRKGHMSPKPIILAITVITSADQTTALSMENTLEVILEYFDEEQVYIVYSLANNQ